MSSHQVCFRMTESNQVGEARRAAMRLARQVGLDETREGQAGIIATELATNLVKHARDGRIWLQDVQAIGTRWLDVVAVDHGPGMNVRECLRDGYSTGGTAGTGLGAVRRLADEFDCYAPDARGTAIVARLYAGPRPPDGCAVGAISLPAPGEMVCGDAWRATTTEDALSVFVADGLGHGVLAAEAAQVAADTFSGAPIREASVLFDDMHRRMTATRGAAVARAVVLSSGNVHYSGIGNIAGSLVGVESSRGLPTQNGTIGVAPQRPVATATYTWPAHGLLIMHSDGLATRWSLGVYPGLQMRHPTVVAAVLTRDFMRGRDDVTTVVARAPQARAA